MRVSQLLGTTLRQVSSENISLAESTLIRAGYLRLSSTGFPPFLHLGQKTLEKIGTHFISEIQSQGGVSINLPLIKYSDFWQKVNLPASLPYNSRALMTYVASGEISSYRQLPGLFYQVNFRAPDPFVEIWGISGNKEEGEKQFENLKEGLDKVFSKIGLQIEQAKGNPGFSLSNQAVDFISLSGIGNKSYLLNDEKYGLSNSFSLSKKSPEKSSPLEIEKVHTPETASIQDLTDFLKIPATQTAKVVFYTGKIIGKDEPQLVIAVIRGDMDVDAEKVRNQVKALSLRAANDEEIKEVGCIPGFASPIGIKRENVIVIADDLIPQINNLAAGANETDYHFINTCYGRDYEADIVADITEVNADSQSANGGDFQDAKANLLGILVNDGEFYSTLFNANFMSNAGRPELLQLNYARIYLKPILFEAGNKYSDENGLAWSEEIAPYQISLVSLADGEETVEQAEALYQELTEKGISVLYDDRHKKVAGPGVKFKDSDLQGIPLRITVSKRARKEGGVEMKKRNEAEKSIVKIEEIGLYLF